MSAWNDCRSVEERSLEILRPFLRQRAYEGQFVVTSKGPLARDLQVSVGDALINIDRDTIYGVEIKSEEKNEYGNLFLETWSNRKRFTLGWMYTLKADLLLYHFIEENLVVRCHFENLRRWCFWQSKIYRYKEKEQKKRAQKNDTWGRPVPISVLVQEPWDGIGARLIDLSNLTGEENAA